MYNSSDELSKELYVEAFGSRDPYIDLVMRAMDRIEEVENTMRVGTPMQLPGLSEEGSLEDKEENESQVRTTSCYVDKLVMDSLDILEEEDDLEIPAFLRRQKN